MLIVEILSRINDCVAILSMCAAVGHNDKARNSDNRMQKTKDLVISKKDKKGRWKLENIYNDRFQTNIEQKDKGSKWINYML